MNDLIDRVRAVNPARPPQPTEYEVASVVTEAIRRGQRAPRRARLNRRTLLLAGSGAAAGVVAAVTVPGLVRDLAKPPSAAAAPLNRFAAEIEAAPHPAPPKPYLYQRVRIEAVKGIHDDGVRYEPFSQVAETWLKLDDDRAREWSRTTADGRRTPLEMACEGDGSCPVGKGGFQTPTPAWARRLPSNPTALESLIRAEVGDEWFNSTVRSLLQYPAVPPEVRATLIRWLPDIPGLTVLGHRTVNGREGIALSTEHYGTRTELVLERRTGVVLEELTRLRGPDPSYPGLPQGTVLDRTSLLDLAYVDKPGATR